jgi:hypothetical protein
MIRRAGFCVLGIVVLLAGLAGCAASTLGRSPHERASRQNINENRQRRALNEDLELVFMTEPGTRLTRWHDR